MIKRLTAAALVFALALVPTVATAKKKPEYIPREKNCVGDPPRQTEDPLSPPCIAYFEGDNGGATWTGVTGEDIKVVFYNDLGISGDLNRPWALTDEAAGHEVHYEKRNLVRTAKAYVRYFSDRMHTYGRIVRIYGVRSTGGSYGSCASRRADAQMVNDVYQPFAVVAYGEDMGCFADELSTEQVVTAGALFHVPEITYEDADPYVFSFVPSREAAATLSASFICTKLKDGNARFSKDPFIQRSSRRFGLIYDDSQARGSWISDQAHALIASLETECGMTPESVDPIRDTGDFSAPSLMARYKAQNISTVICYCLPVPSEMTVTKMQMAASGINYLPEWYWDSTSAMDKTVWSQIFANPEHTSFGSSWLWRQPAFRESYAYGAYQSMEPGSTPNERFHFWLYHSFLTFYTGLQSAGPNLTPSTFKAGMETFNYQNQASVYTPVGGFGSYNANAIGDHTFIDTAMGWWWDPTGRDAGEDRPGCIRVAQQGRRFYPSQWTSGDSDLLDPHAPCGGTTHRAFL